MYESCWTCKFARNVDSDNNHRTFVECHRRCPVPVDAMTPMEIRSQWPRVDPDEWCGEWQPKPEKGTADAKS